MDGSDHSGISSSTPIKRSSTPKVSSSVTGTNENDKNYQQMGMNLQNSKKPMAKNFMSPTISAASKAIAPRKKILGERNEISDTNTQNTSNFDNSEDSCSLNDDSPLKSSDPLPKNYPSPRPQFLRYKPNRCREIILRHENEAKEERKEGPSIDKDISLPCKENEGADLVCGSEEVEENDEVVEEEEEEEEENEGFLRRVLKLTLVLVFLMVSTLHISSMNSPETSPALQAMDSFKNGYFKVHDHFLNKMEFKEIVKILRRGGEFFDGNLGLMKVNQTVLGKCIAAEREIVEDVYLLKGKEISGNLGEEGELEGGESKDEVVFDQMVEGEESEDEVVFDQMVENFEFKETESIIDKLESLEDNHMMQITSNAFEQENEFAMEAVTEEVDNVGDVELEMVESDGMTKTEHISDNSGEGSISESVDKESPSFEIVNFEAENELKEGIVEQIGTDEVVIGGTIVLAIVAVFGIGFAPEEE
ncbi:Protein Ycf2 like [Melia azedarach]|uniref:Protein Ycf2 like n=1 Tax=Melia azedarach TaxID=155640 RepID=A0ACC1Y3R6_MELAZ|nr:Protein Ycf2 like [Melia azedarach]